MLRVTHYAENHVCSADEYLLVQLPYDMRKRSRIRAITSCGKDVGFFLERGNILSEGDLLQAETGELVRIQAAAEEVSTVTCDDSLKLLKTAYHLGNRHVPLQVCADGGINWLRYQEDYVLDDMVKQLGADVTHESVPFHPEPGAYGGNGKVAGGHHHDHSDGEGHSHG